MTVLPKQCRFVLCFQRKAIVMLVSFLSLLLLLLPPSPLMKMMLISMHMRNKRLSSSSCVASRRAVLFWRICDKRSRTSWRRDNRPVPTTASTTIRPSPPSRRPSMLRGVCASSRV
jgi:hypothetical protein